MRSGMQRSSPAGLALVMCLAWAVPATARDSGVWQGYREYRGRHHDHHQEGRRRHHDQHRADRGRHHDHYWEGRRRHHDHYREGRRRHRDHYSGVSRTGRGHRDSVYYCAACRQRFDSRGRFHHHLQQHHHIPLWQIPWVVVHGLVHGTPGWVFHG